MRVVLLVLNFVAMLIAARWGVHEFGRYSNDNTVVVIVFGGAFLLSVLNLAYIKTTPPVYRWRGRISRFLSAWKASSD